MPRRVLVDHLTIPSPSAHRPRQQRGNTLACGLIQANPSVFSSTAAPASWKKQSICLWTDYSRFARPRYADREAKPSGARQRFSRDYPLRVGPAGCRCPSRPSLLSDQIQLLATSISPIIYRLNITSGVVRSFNQQRRNRTRRRGGSITLGRFVWIRLSVVTCISLGRCLRV